MSVRKRFARLDSSLQKLDGTLQRGLNNGFAYVMGGKVVASEVEDRLRQEIEDNKVATYEGFTESPNVFTIALSATDFAHLRQSDPQLAVSSADMLQRLARNNGWVSAGPVVVSIVCDEGLKTGQIHSRCACDPKPSERTGFVTADGEVIPGPPEGTTPRPATAERDNHDPYTQQQPAQQPGLGSHPAAVPGGYSHQQPVPHYRDMVSSTRHAPTVTLLLQDGSSRTYLVVEGSNIIGRGQDADFRLPDTGVSRRHAEITWDGRDAVLVDLHSTNGTTVNDIPIDNWLLADGDVITVGHSYIEVRITGS